MRLYTEVRDIVYAVTFFEDVQKDLGKLKDDINIVQKKGEEWVIEDNAPFDEMKKIMQTEKENLMLKIVDILKDIKKKCDISVEEETPKDTNSCNEDSSRITDLSILKMKHEETLNDLRKCQAEMRRMSSEIEKLKSTMNNYTLNSDVVFKGKIDVEKDLEMSHDEEEEDAADSQVLTPSTCFTPNEEEEDAADSQVLTPSTCLTPAVINRSEPSPRYEDLSPYSRNADEESPPKIRRR